MWDSHCTPIPQILKTLVTNEASEIWLPLWKHILKHLLGDPIGLQTPLSLVDRCLVR
jgi:hypothetical protein